MNTVISQLQHRTAFAVAVVAVFLSVAAAAFAAHFTFQTAAAQSEAGAPANVTASDGDNHGEVTVRWTPDTTARFNRVGWANITEVQAAQAAGNWLEAFNFTDQGGAKSTYTVKRLEPGTRHAFIVATGAANGAIIYSEWVLHTTAAAPAPTPMPAPAQGNCLPIQSIGTFSGFGSSANDAFSLGAGVYRFTASRQNTEGSVFFIDLVELDTGEEISVGIYGGGEAGGVETETVQTKYDFLPRPGNYLLKVETDNAWTVLVELIQAH